MQKSIFIAIAVALAALAFAPVANLGFAQTSTTTTTSTGHHFFHHFGGGIGLGLGARLGLGFGFHQFAHPFFFGNHFYTQYQEVQPQTVEGSVVVSCPVVNVNGQNVQSVLVDNQCVIPTGQVASSTITSTTPILTQSGEEDGGQVIQSLPQSVVVPSSQCASIPSVAIVSTGTFGGQLGGFDTFGGFHVGHFHDGDHVRSGNFTR